MLINIERTAFLEVNSLQKYKKLFFSTFELSACTFGGGFVIIPLMRKKFVEELGWIEEDEMMDLTAIAQSSPGAIAVNASILVGYHVAGFPGNAHGIGNYIAAIDNYFYHFHVLSGISR